MEGLFRKFYCSLDASLRMLIEYKMAERGASPSEFFERPWLFFRIIELELGRHIAELIKKLFMEFAKRYGLEAVAKALSNPEEFCRQVGACS